LRRISREAVIQRVALLLRILH